MNGIKEKEKNKNYESLGKMFYCQYKSKRKRPAVRAIGVTEDGEIGLNRLKMVCNYPENHREQNLNIFAF